MSKETIRKIYLLPVRFYQKFLSPFLGGQCIYSPTCSNYFTQAVLKHGIVKGTILGSHRILRCSHLYIGGLDNVPENFSFRAMRATTIAFRRHVRVSHKADAPKTDKEN